GVGGQGCLDAVVGLVQVGGEGGRLVAQAQRVAELVGGDGLEVEAGADLPLDVGVEQDVAGDGAAVGRRRQEGLGQDAGGQRDGADADVAEAGVALLGAVGAQRVARVGDQGEVEVGVGLPGGGGLLDLSLPGGGGG